MKRSISCLLALAMVTASASAAAQSYGSYGVEAGNSYYDYARVIRVDPVFASAYGGRQRCYESTTPGSYAGEAGYYGDYGDYGYGSRYGGGDDGRLGGSQAGRTLATIAGGVVGAVLGSKVGGGSGQVAAAAVGSMVGGIAGRQIYDQSQQYRASRTGTVRVCDPEPVRGGYGSYGGYRGDAAVSSYDVTYEYNGHRYTRRMGYNPGDRIRVRVEVVPE